MDNKEGLIIRRAVCIARVVQIRSKLIGSS